MPPLIVTDSSYEFVPPHEGNVWPRLLSRFATHLVGLGMESQELEEKRTRIVMEVRGQSKKACNRKPNR